MRKFKLWLLALLLTTVAPCAARASEIYIDAISMYTQPTNGCTKTFQTGTAFPNAYMDCSNTGTQEAYARIPIPIGMSNSVNVEYTFQPGVSLNPGSVCFDVSINVVPGGIMSAILDTRAIDPTPATISLSSVQMINGWAMKSATASVTMFDISGQGDCASTTCNAAAGYAIVKFLRNNGCTNSIAGSAKLNQIHITW